MISWEPELWNGAASSPAPGACPNQLATEPESAPAIAFLHRYAREVAAFGKPILFALACVFALRIAGELLGRVAPRQGVNPASLCLPSLGVGQVELGRRYAQFILGCLHLPEPSPGHDHMHHVAGNGARPSALVLIELIGPVLSSSLQVARRPSRQRQRHFGRELLRAPKFDDPFQRLELFAARHLCVRLRWLEPRRRGFA